MVKWWKTYKCLKFNRTRKLCIPTCSTTAIYSILTAVNGWVLLFKICTLFGTTTNSSDISSDLTPLYSAVLPNKTILIVFCLFHCGSSSNKENTSSFYCSKFHHNNHPWPFRVISAQPFMPYESWVYRNYLKCRGHRSMGRHGKTKSTIQSLNISVQNNFIIGDTLK